MSTNSKRLVRFFSCLILRKLCTIMFYYYYYYYYNYYYYYYYYYYYINHVKCKESSCFVRLLLTRSCMFRLLFQILISVFNPLVPYVGLFVQYQSCLFYAPPQLIFVSMSKNSRLWDSLVLLIKDVTKCLPFALTSPYLSNMKK